MLYPGTTQSASQVPAQSASLAQFSTKTHYTPGPCSQRLPPLSTCIIHDSLVILNKPNNSPTTHSTDGRLRLASPCDRDIIQLQHRGRGEASLSPFPALSGRVGGHPCCVALQAPFLCLPAPRGTDALFSTEARPWLTGLSLFMPFALIAWAGLPRWGSAGAILRVAK